MIIVIFELQKTFCRIRVSQKLRIKNRSLFFKQSSQIYCVFKLLHKFSKVSFMIQNKIKKSFS